MPRTRIHLLAVLFVALFLGSPAGSRANNIRVTNPAAHHLGVQGETTVYIRFNLSWENSWRNDLNHDAAWVFVKFRAPGSNEWQHAILSTNRADHVLSEGAEVRTVPDGMGVFIERHADSSPFAGNVDYRAVRLLWDFSKNGYAFTMGTPIEISVHAIEMVYVPEGAFYLGSGGTEDRRFHAGGAPNTEPFLVDAAWNGPLDSTDDARRTGDTLGRLWATQDIQGGTFGDGYPIGYDAFYCMKYPVTQGQYADFLSRLTATQGNARFANQYGISRHIIREVELGVPGAYTAEEAPDRICNWLTSADSLAYADWAGLRPITELEFEKACRGFANPVPNEYAWGTISISSMTAGERDPELDGTGREMAPANRNATDGLERAGITAANATTRAEAGASYWGIQDLTSFVILPAVSAGTQASRDFSGLHGNGILTSAGVATIAGWPVLCGRNSGWNQGDGKQPVSVRSSASQGMGTGRKEQFGFRAVRTAPVWP